MRAMVAAVWRERPPLVSPDSITASAPRRPRWPRRTPPRAWAAVGDHHVQHLRRDDHQLPCVAARMAASAPAATVPTASPRRGPRGPPSPRRTPRRSPPRSATASGFSSLAITGTRLPTSSMTACASLTSSGARTNDIATMSAPSCSANFRSSMSLSDSGGTLTSTPGNEMPLWSLTGPPFENFAPDVGARDVEDPQIDLAVVDEQFVPGPHVVRQPLVRRGHPIVVTCALGGGDHDRYRSPVAHTTGPSAKRPSRIFGPCRSASTPTHAAALGGETDGPCRTRPNVVLGSRD